MKFAPAFVAAATMVMALPTLAAPPPVMALDSSEPLDSGIGLSLDVSSEEPSAPMDVLPPDDEDAAPMPQDTGPPVASKTMMQTFYDVCADIGSDKPDATARASAAGWLPYDDDTTIGGPYRRVFSAYQDFSGYGQVDLFSTIVTFPTQKLGYCRIDLYDAQNALDFADLTGIGGLTGTIKTENGIDYGSWESPDHTLLIAADREQGTAEFEFNIIFGTAPSQN